MSDEECDVFTGSKRKPKDDDYLFKARAWDALIARLEVLETYAGNRSQYERTRRLVNEVLEETLPVRYEV